MKYLWTEDTGAGLHFWKLVSQLFFENKLTDALLRLCDQYGLSKKGEIMKNFWKSAFFILLGISLFLTYPQKISAAEMEETLQTDRTENTEKTKWEFVIRDGVLVEYRGYRTKVVIPDGVTAIGAGAFSENGGLADVVLPEGVERIEKSAFSGCSSLENVQLPKSLYYIGDHAFEACALTDIDLRAVEKLGAWVFAGTDIDFSGLEHLPEMEGNAFAHSRYWWEYGEGRDKNAFWIVDGVLLSGQNCSGRVEIPNTVERIAADAFTDNHKITSVYIPYSVTEIGEEAFWYCTELKWVWMENSVEKMGREVFFNCSELAQVRLSNQIRQLPAGTFERCGKLERWTLQKKLIFPYRYCNMDDYVDLLSLPI